jgi:Tfp pilus assembly protein PilF
MLGIRAILVAVSAALLLCACSSTGSDNGLFATTAEQKLGAGIKNYEEGDYQSALATIRDAQEMGLDDKVSQVRAHKYVAFIHCVSGREKQCREEFKKALEINPSFELKPEEEGHPVWGPVFRGEKARLAQ